MDLLELRRKALGQKLVCFIERYEDDVSCRAKQQRVRQQLLQLALQMAKEQE